MACETRIRRDVPIARNGIFRATWQYQRRARARVTASGSRAMTRSNVRAGPVGTRRRVSYWRIASTEKPKRAANASWERPSCVRSARTSSTSSGTMRRPAARISSGVNNGAVSVSTAAWRATSSSVVASTRCQAIFARSRSLREDGAIGMAFTLVRFAQADDPSDRVVRGAAPCVDAHQYAPGHAAIGDDPPFCIIASLIIDFDRGTVEQRHGDLERQTSLTRSALALRWIPAKAHEDKLGQRQTMSTTE